MKILGLDPGLVNTGWAVIQYEGNSMSYIQSGTIQTSKEEALSDRLVTIFHALEDVMRIYVPQKAAVEETFVNKNGQTTLKLGQARAMSVLVPALAGLDVAEYSANLVKKSVVGSGHADKNQIEIMVKVLIKNADPKTEHEADALAVAICHAHHHTLMSAKRKGKVA